MKKDNLMKRLTNAAVELKNDERGLTTVEYVILLVLICVLAIGMWKTFGESVTNQVTSSSNSINALSTP